MKIHIKNNSVYPNKIFAIGLGNDGFDTLEFVFSKEWFSLSKRIIFVSADGNQISVKYNGYPIEIPIKTLKQRGRSFIYVIGEKGSVSKTAVPIELVVVGNYPINSSESEE